MEAQAANFLTTLAARARDIVAIFAVLLPIWLFLSDNVNNWIGAIARAAFSDEIDELTTRLTALEVAVSLAVSSDPPVEFESSGNMVTDGVIGGLVAIKVMAKKSRDCGRPSISIRFRDSSDFIHAFDTLGFLDDVGRGPSLQVWPDPQAISFRVRIPADAGVETGNAQAWLELGSFEQCPSVLVIRSPEIPFRIMLEKKGSP